MTAWRMAPEEPLGAWQPLETPLDIPLLAPSAVARVNAEQPSA